MSAKAEDLAQLNARLKAEVRCEADYPPVAGEGNADTGVMFIGHCPGGTDVQVGRPYTGPAGQLFDQLLVEAGITRADLYITNLVKCWCFREENGQRVNRNPTAKAVKEWVPTWLKPELEIIQPRAIVALGGPTAQHFLGKDFKITQQGGEWLELPDNSPYLKLAGGIYEPRPLVMGVPQANYLMHLQEHAPEAYPDARANLVANLIKVKRVLEGQRPELKKARPKREAGEEVDLPF
jgi:DNA polymerase